MPTFASAQPVITACPAASSGVAYQRRESERTRLHRIVRENLASFLAEAAERSSPGLGHLAAAQLRHRRACMRTLWRSEAAVCALHRGENGSKILEHLDLPPKPLLSRRPEHHPTPRIPRVEALKTASIPLRRAGSPRLSPQVLLSRSDLACMPPSAV